MWAAAHGQIAVVEFLLQNVRKMPQKMYMYSYLSSAKSLVEFLYIQPARYNGRGYQKSLMLFIFSWNLDLVGKARLIIHATVRNNLMPRPL